MTAEDILAGVMAAISAGLLTSYAILAVPTARCLVQRLRRRI